MNTKKTVNANRSAELDTQRESNDAVARSGFMRSSTTPPKLLGTADHEELMRMVDSLPTATRAAITPPRPDFPFDMSYLQTGEQYVGIVPDAGIYRHLILLPAEAQFVTWNQARVFAAAAGGVLPDFDDFDLLEKNFPERLHDEDSYWSSELLNQKEAFYVCFGDYGHRDVDSVDSLTRACVVRHEFAGFEHSVSMTWHTHIKVAREAAGMSVERLAELVGVMPSTVARWESGETRTISGPHLANVCTVLNVDGAWLLGADDE
ncbi:helix-turn-helix domain-containing protein [Massilia sp. Root335]|uniref:helix-turn-helix domain-containing protein n=1 Tax=Massilia sp. Root335 TaxID=1736517 RepID=UPI0006F30EA7|nr:helix-turn-helix transcriptional regulator [Massilia sp. Root335]